jgi:hypothetical protein
MQFPSDKELVNGWPTRAQVEAVWLSLIDGATNREQVRRWAARWVEEAPESPLDGAIRVALQHLHGFSVWSQNGTRRASADPYQFTLDDIQVRFLDWRLSCEEYDKDPLGWRLSQIERTAEGKQRFLEGK